MAARIPSDLPSPPIILDHAVLHRNLRRMTGRLRLATEKRRQHLKTSKYLQFARMATADLDGGTASQPWQTPVALPLAASRTCRSAWASCSLTSQRRPTITTTSPTAISTADDRLRISTIVSTADDHQSELTVCPPSTVSTLPVMNSPASEASSSSAPSR